MISTYATPIIFSAPMIRALLDGRKSQTRRLVTSQWANLKMHFDQGERCFVWVREMLQNDGDGDWCHAADSAYIAAGYPEGWRLMQSHKASIPSIYMPRWASRLTLEVTDVRLQRLQDITEEDAVAEGVEPVLNERGDVAGWKSYDKDDLGFYSEAVNSYDSLWESLHGKGSWDTNPEVIAISFRVHRQNIDVLLAECAAA